jgi:hypothetical protein
MFQAQAAKPLVRVAGSLVAALAVGAWLSAGDATACDSTSCLMLTRGTAGLMGKGGVRLDLSWRYTDQSARLEGSQDTDQVIRPKVWLERGLLIPGYHEELRGSESFLQLDGAWGVGDRTTLFGSVPLLGQRHYTIGHGGFETPYNVHGLGDMVVGVRQAIQRSSQRALVVGVGVKLPTGRNSVIDGYDGTLLDPTLQPGTGSGDFQAALQWSSVGPANTELSFAGSYQVNTTNGEQYRFGNELIAAATVSRPLRRLVPSLQVKLNQRGRSSLVDKSVPSTGATLLYLNTGLRLRASDGLGFYGFFLFPAYRNVNDAQLAPRFSVLLGLSKTL